MSIRLQVRASFDISRKLERKGFNIPAKPAIIKEWDLKGKAHPFEPRTSWERMNHMKKILVVDDEKPISDIISFNLENEGYAIEKAYDG